MKRMILLCVLVLSIVSMPASVFASDIHVDVDFSYSTTYFKGSHLVKFTADLEPTIASTESVSWYYYIYEIGANGALTQVNYGTSTYVPNKLKMQSAYLLANKSYKVKLRVYHTYSVNNEDVTADQYFEYYYN